MRWGKQSKKHKYIYIYISLYISLYISIYIYMYLFFFKWIDVEFSDMYR